MKIPFARLFSTGTNASAFDSPQPAGKGMELATLYAGFQNDLKMRLATEIQGEMVSTAERDRTEKANPKPTHQKHEIRSLSESGSAQGPEHFALTARATNDAVRDW
ncbi:MAG: hypothetical protein M3N12_06490, partial [Verrucomicrobiota bacterium]|nr:hypothetical protein [Verrucomicrobiota bacterium]